jgi:hypothetical protein
MQALYALGLAVAGITMISVVGTFPFNGFEKSFNF